MRIFEQIQFKSKPVVLAAWPGMGNVGLITVDYIRRQIEAKPFAEIDMSPFFIPDSIIVKDGIAQFPEIPTSIFYYHFDPDLIIFESNAQIIGREGIMIIRTLLDLIGQYHVQQIFTFAAFAGPTSYKNDSEVLVTCNTESMLELMQQHGTTPMPDGYIAGLNGLLLGVAASRKIEAACMLGTIPGYAANLSYPKASLALVKSISKFLLLSPDLKELKGNVDELEQQYALIEERIKEFFPNVNKDDDQEIASMEEEKVPHYVMEKIERLFKEALENRSVASELKRELDRWNLFELYENRFLDLFQDHL